MSKLNDFISLTNQAADQSGIKIVCQSYRSGDGIVITKLDRRTDRHVDVDRFLIEITSLATQDGFGIQLSLDHNDMPTKMDFARYGFQTLEDSHHLQMQWSPPSRVTHHEQQFEPELVESAPPGEKAERFIKHRKKEFKKRYGKHWKKVLYATAWKHFGESRTHHIRDYLALVESAEKD